MDNEKSIRKGVSLFWMVFFFIAGILLFKYSTIWWMSLLGFVSVILWFGALLELIKRKKPEGASFTHSEIAEFNIKYYFSCAIYAWIVLKDDAAYHAALTAGKVFDRADRQQAVDNLERVANEFIEKAKEAKEAGDHEEMNNLLSASMKMINLHKALSEKEWTLSDIIKDKLKLEKIDHEYLEALNNFDSTVFEERYPDENFERLIIQ